MANYPLIKEVLIPRAAPQVFELFKDRPFAFFLDSGMDPEKLGRYSFIGSDPFLVFQSRGREITIHEQGRENVVQGDPFQVLAELVERYRLIPHQVAVPFSGGAVGYFGYDLCHFIEKLPSTAVDDLQFPECHLAFYDAILAFDNLKGQAYVVSTGFPLSGSQAREKAQIRLGELRQMLSDTPEPDDKEVYPLPQLVGSEVELRSNFSHEGYLEAVARAKEYIRAGDIFQVNLSQRFESDLPLPPYQVYKRLRALNPAPFACYLDLGDLAIVSASPERFLRLGGDGVETRPIKGTRPRGQTPAEDEALAQELMSSAKDQAEHVMIVDLERNDLGRVCALGSVTVSELMVLEKYATVFHLTSTVEGRLRAGTNRIDLIRACFPGGSITGAPKVRAMEIIDELEPTKRSVYTGAIGYLSFSGGLDLNIAIRTILIKEGKAYFQVGGGIVYDSNPEAEYLETLDKAKALIWALGRVPQLVTP